jgi:hypothetical protein
VLIHLTRSLHYVESYHLSGTAARLYREVPN